MKKIINGRLYDTDTAILIGYWDNGYGAGDFHKCYEELYRKKNGEFFLYGSGGAMTVYADPCAGGWSGGISPFLAQKNNRRKKNANQRKIRI